MNTAAAPRTTGIPRLHRPADLGEAVRFLADNPGAVPVAGGTDLLIDRRLGRITTDCMVDISHLDISGIERDGDHLRIGATTTIRTIETSTELAVSAPALLEAARVLGSIQIRNMATLGGNLCHATPSAEMPPPLLVFDAEATIVSSSGWRTIELAQLFTGPGETSLQPGELLTGVTAHVGDGIGSCYIRQTVRWAMDLAGVGVAASVRIEPETNGIVSSVRVALAAVNPVPTVVEGLDSIMVGKTLDADVLDEAAALARQSASPISDARGTAQYRRHVVGVLTARALRVCTARAANTWLPNRAVPPNGFDPELLVDSGVTR